MSRFEESLQDKQKYLKKIIKSLSKLSNVQTQELRKEVNLSSNKKKDHKIKYRLQRDVLLRGLNKPNLPNLLQADKVYVHKMNNVQSLKEKKIESQACLKKVNFQFLKLKIIREKMARKLYQSQERYKSSPKLENQVLDARELRNNRISQIFEKGTLRSPTSREEIEDTIVKRLKTTVNSSRKHLQSKYQDEEYMKSLVSSNKKGQSELKIEEEKEKTSEFSFLTEQDSPTPRSQMMKTQTVIGQSNQHKKIKRKSLIDLIRLSSSREKHKDERPDQKLTLKETEEYRGIEATIQTLRKHIDRDNKLKESIVFSGLKKLLYGDRKGRFIQDNAFKTRLQGECSDHYLNILKAQQQILQNFNGSYFNRKNLVQKFSDILGKVHKTEVHDNIFD